MIKNAKKKDGFTLEVSPEIADILGVKQQDELLFVVKDDEVILRAKKNGTANKEKSHEETNKLTQRLVKQYASVLKKLAKT